MSRILPQQPQYSLALADGSRWVIGGGDAEGASIVSQLGGAMRLRAVSPSAESSHNGLERRLLVSIGDNPEGSPRACYTPPSPEDDGFAVCVLRRYAGSDGLFAQILDVSLVIARDAQARGGVLIHGALAEWDGIGVILAAPAGTGKTTASSRLQAPWRALCDDITLVVRDPQGHYWAHPWPSWSRFLWGGRGGSWEVQHAVPLKGIFVLSRAAEDSVEPVGPGHAVSMLVECAKQASACMVFGAAKEETRALHLERFNNLCALVRAVPVHLLHISLTGAFWREIERVL